MAKKPESPATKTPARIGTSMLVSMPDPKAAGASMITEPRIDGMEIKNANFTAKSRSKPEINPPTRVAPDLDIPGVIAMDWQMPIRMA